MAQRDEERDEERKNPRAPNAEALGCVGCHPCVITYR